MIKYVYTFVISLLVFFAYTIIANAYNPFEYPVVGEVTVLADNSFLIKNLPETDYSCSTLQFAWIYTADDSENIFLDIEHNRSTCIELDDTTINLIFSQLPVRSGEYYIKYQLPNNNDSRRVTHLFIYSPSEISPMPTTVPSPAPTNTPISTSTPTVTLIPSPTSIPLSTPSPTVHPTLTTVPTLAIQRKLTALRPAKVWLSLKNPNDLTIKFDVKAEILKNNAVISFGQVEGVSPGMGLFGFSGASQHAIKFNNFSHVFLPKDSRLKVRLSIRNACRGSLRNSGVARLWYGDKQANTQVGVTLDGKNKDYYFVNDFLLSPIAGTGMKKSIDVETGGRCSDFKPFGTWAVTL